MTELTHAELTRLLDYDPETGVFRWRVDRGAGVKAGDIAGWRGRYGNQLSLSGKVYSSRRIAWFYVNNEIPTQDLFVKNGDCNDDRINNIGVLPKQPKELTQEYLRQCIDYNPENGEFKWKITQGTNLYGHDAFCLHITKLGKKSCRTTILKKSHSTNRLIFYWMMGYMPSPDKNIIPIDKNLMNKKWENISLAQMTNDSVNHVDICTAP